MRARFALVALALAPAACFPPRYVVARPAARDGAPTLFAGVMVFDGLSDRATGPHDVLVSGGRVTALGAPGTLAVPAGAVRVDGAARTLMPGLVDMHVHVGGADGGPPWSLGLPDPAVHLSRFPYAGVTAVFAALRQGDFEAMAASIRDGDLAGPLLYRASRGFCAPGGHPLPMTRAVGGRLVAAYTAMHHVRQVATPDEARRAVREEIAATHPDAIKIIYDAIPDGTPHLTRETLVAIVDEARAASTRAAVHVGGAGEAMDAVQAGASILMHVPWEDDLTDEQAKVIAASGVPLVTTARVMATVGELWRGELAFGPLDRTTSGSAVIASFAARPPGYEVPGFPASYFDSLPELARHTGVNVRKLKAAGATLFAGTDCGVSGLFQGSSLHRELAALVSLGFTPAEAIRAATSLPARWLDPKAGFGSIAPGSRADLVLVEGDPTRDIAATQAIVGVWQKGRRVERQAAP